MTYYRKNESIECKKSQIRTRKVIPQQPKKDPSIGLVIGYSCERNSIATIQKELEPKAPIKSEYSHLDLHDSIKGEKIRVLVQGIRRVKPKKEGGETGTHSIQVMNTSTYTYAKISQPFKHIQDALDKRTGPTDLP
ncbi:MAG: hypothetical protein K9J27_04870 [Bacteroidales bacterium]|nr:hypothetical protein [Bacteroidales bacterium]MCF8333163.1 hypothetical protein [Bacteroidales bacterium]